LLPGEWVGENPYTPEAQADLVIRLMDIFGIDQAILVGNSAGGTIATLTALRHPERVQALVLADAAIYSGGGTPAWLGPILRSPQVQRLGPLVSRSVRLWGESAARSAWHDPSKLTPEIWEGSNRYQQVENWDRALWEFTLASHPLGLPERLDQIEIPTLVITGDDDRIVPTEESLRLADEIPNAELSVLPNCGHAPQQECPEAFLEALGEFLELLRVPRLNFRLFCV
jgi:pimeloyl-ACP methyl ester carboxylesterase